MLINNDNKPHSIIFLEFEGILLDNKPDKNRLDLIDEKAQALFKDRSNGNFTPMELKRAWCALMDSEAVGHLMTVINTIKEIAEVGIVITSSWRNEHSLEGLKEILRDQPFAKNIVDKIASDAGSLKSTENEQCKEKYGFYFGSSRGKQIAFWLFDNKRWLGVRNFIILDQSKNDEDHEIAELFPDHFIKCDKLLRE